MIVVGGLAVRAGKVLMGKRPEGKMRPGMWEYPGGKLEPGEHPHEALVREWHEELGVVVSVGAWIGRCAFTVESRIEWDLYHVHVPWDAVLLNQAHTELRWVDAEEAVRMLPCTPTTYLVYPDVMAFLEHAVIPAGSEGT